MPFVYNKLQLTYCADVTLELVGIQVPLTFEYSVTTKGKLPVGRPLMVALVTPAPTVAIPYS